MEAFAPALSPMKAMQHGVGRGSNTPVYGFRLRTVRKPKNCSHINLIPHLAPKFRDRYKAAHLLSRASSGCVGSRERRSVYLCFPYLASTLLTLQVHRMVLRRSTHYYLFCCLGVFLRGYEYTMDAFFAGALGGRHPPCGTSSLCIYCLLSWVG